MSRVVINTSEMLSANTVITGAKIVFNILGILKWSQSLSPRSKACARMMNGKITMTARKNATLMISTRARATKGKNNQIAKNILISISQVICPNDVSVWILARSVKLSMEE